MASQQPAAGRLALAALLILSAAAGLAAADPAAAAAAGGVGSEPRQVRFRPDGTFVIAQFADLHYSDDEERDAHSDQVSRQLGARLHGNNRCICSCLPAC